MPRTGHCSLPAPSLRMGTSGGRRHAVRRGRTHAPRAWGREPLPVPPWIAVCVCPRSPPVRTDLGTFTHSGVLISLDTPESVGSYLRWYVHMSSRFIFPNSSCAPPPAHTLSCHRRCPTSDLERPRAQSQAGHGETDGFCSDTTAKEGKGKAIFYFMNHTFFQVYVCIQFFSSPHVQKTGLFPCWLYLLRQHVKMLS